MVLVRPATSADYPEIGRISVEAYRADGQLADDNPYQHTLRDVAGRAQGNEILVAVDVETQAVLGSVTLPLPGSELIELSKPGELEFRMLAVDPAAQGRGAGTALVRACVARAVERGCSAVVICTRDFAKRAMGMYERLGFVRAPELDWTAIPDVRLLGLRLELGPSAPRAALSRSAPAG